MKKLFKILGIIVLSFIAIIAVTLLFLNFSELPTYEVAEIEYHASNTPEAIERGQKLSMMLCGSCHMNYETGNLTGKRMMDAPPEFGVIYSQNITQDNTYGIGEWTDAELLYLLRTGIKRNGQYAPPYMAKVPNMADEDIDAIISFLRSDHPTIAADPTPDQPCEPSLLTKVLSRTVFKPFPMPEERIEMPDTEDKVALGRYLAINLDCFSCHSADFKTNDFLSPEKSSGYFAGGNKPLDEQGRVMFTPNLTPHLTAGIGQWNEEQFVNAVKYGKIEDQHALQYPMIPYSLLSDYEAGAIYKYLQTIPAIENEVERSVYDM